MAATIAKSIELLDISEFQPGLFLNPVAKADFERPMLQRGKKAEGQGKRCHSYGSVPRQNRQYLRLVVNHGNDGRVQPNLDSHIFRQGCSTEPGYVHVTSGYEKILGFHAEDRLRTFEQKRGPHEFTTMRFP